MSSFSDRKTIKPMTKQNMNRAMKRIYGELFAIISSMPPTGQERGAAFSAAANVDAEIRKLWEPAPDPLFVARAVGRKP